MSEPGPGPGSPLVSGNRGRQLATALLQQMRLASPTGGIWEAADVQWWSRLEGDTEQHGQRFWLACGEPVAAVLRTDFGDFTQCDVLVRAGHEEHERAAWQEAVHQGAAAAVEFPVRDDNAVAVAALAGAGFLASAEPPVVSSWLGAAGRPAIPALPPGYKLRSRADAPGRPHPMTSRNGPEIAERLRQCSLYRPELDLMVEAPDGKVAGYGLFWADPVTRVGLVEPMRTEQAFQGRGIAGHVLAAGLDLLERCGCDRLKVSSDLGLYLRAGFRPLTAASASIYRKARDA
jgi:GNAT superfamily N-acetyltransferase